MTESTPHRKGQAMTTHNRLQLNQTIMLSDWLKSKSEYEPGTQHKTIADEAASALGFAVTAHNLRTVADAVGYQLPPARKPKVDPLAEMQGRIDDLEMKLEVHTSRFASVISDILELQAYIRAEDDCVTKNLEPVPSIDGTLYSMSEILPGV
jgi:hypothetical protein